METDRDRLLKLSLQGALFLELTDNMFAISAGFTGHNEIKIRAYCYAAPDDDDRDSLGTAASYVFMDFYESGMEADVHQECVDASAMVVLEDLGFWAIVKQRKPTEDTRFTPLP